MYSFDSFLEKGGHVERAGKTELGTTAISWADIRDWRDTSETCHDELGRLVVERRTRLWRMVLASYGRSEDCAFTVPADPRLHMTLRRADRRTMEWAVITPTETPCPFLPLFMDDSIPLEGQSLYSLFTIPIAPRSRALHYTLRPRIPARHELPLQQVHISPYAIPPEVADIRCSTLTAAMLLEKINDIFGTMVPLERVQNIVTINLSDSLDLGMVYAQLRPWWPPPPLEPEARSLMMNSRQPPTWHVGFRRMMNGSTASPVPRRLWDLYSNRVVLFDDLYFVRDSEEIPLNVWAVSHSWVADADRCSVMTPINGFEWSVPIPKATTLDHIRIELLNMGAEYVFLDVLCLRQAGDEALEAQRRQEWEDDVPHLGYVYRQDRYQTTVTYFNGLGLPYSLCEEELDLPYHWLNRAWTLQEAVVNWLPGGLSSTIGGLSHGGPRFIARMRSVLAVSTLPFPTLRELLAEFMYRPGYADKKPFDQVAALNYLLPNGTLMAYYEGYESAEEAWDDIVARLSNTELLYLLACVPLARQADPGAQLCGQSRWSWWPTWSQLMNCGPHAPVPTNAYAPQENLRHSTLQSSANDSFGDEWHYHCAFVVERCRISRDRSTLTVYDDGGARTFDFVPYAGDDDLDNKQLTIIGLAGLECWTIGLAGEERKLLTDETGTTENMLEVEKLTVGRMYRQEDREAMRTLDIGQSRHVCYRYRSRASC